MLVRLILWCFTPRPGLLQVKKNVKGKAGAQERPAAGLTKEEFRDHVDLIQKIIHVKWDSEKYGEPVLMWDNLHAHNLQKAELAGLHLGNRNVRKPPPYSGDFMQPIEHTHGTICAAFHKLRFQQGLPAYDVQKDFELLKKAFFNTVKPSAVEADCKRVQTLVKHVAHENTGGYAPTKMC